MSDPKKPPPDDDPYPLFGTRHAAGQKAASKSAMWRARILAWLGDRGPSTLFEVAAGYFVPDHVISGRFTDLAKDGLIERTGQTKTKPETGCPCDVWRLRTPPT